jgi:hypothetical protein
MTFEHLVLALGAGSVALLLYVRYYWGGRRKGS